MGENTETLNSQDGEKADLKPWVRPNIVIHDIAKITENGAASSVDGQAGMMMHSDLRLKRDVKRVGMLDNGLALYRFRYDKDPSTNWVGVMAQDLLKAHTDALAFDESGYLMVDFAKIGFEMVSYDEWVIADIDCG